MRVHQKVRTYLDNNEIMQSVVAMKAGIPFEIFSEILNGTRIMYAEDLRAVCYALKVAPELFLECDGGEL
ncbi:MAG: XRE family transcriptional regulator [Oscillospiraceae bacterium]|nr:XRE family transcriptional regulator [Oscillospiraceae bacterium]MCL2279978.1 XRE family transcriptional regulator [Oscillospiraceae bacterium]